MPENTYPITWEETSEHEYETGVSKGVLYPKNTVGAYGVGVPWHGLISVSETPSGGEVTKLYANNSAYVSLLSAEELGGTIEAYTYPDEFAECDGSASLAEGVTIGQQTRKGFGVCFRTNIGDADNADKGYKLHLIYNMMAKPSERSYQTVNESPDAMTMSWEYTTTPVAVPGHKPTALVTVDSTKVEAAKLAALEAILYGSGSTAPALPTIETLIQTLGVAG